MPRSSRPKTWLQEWRLREEAQGGKSSAKASGRRAEKPDEELGASARVVAEFSAKALKGNYEAIRALVSGQSLIPMIKADAYGHGAAWAGRTLLGMPALYGFGVATLGEGALLREELGAAGRKTRIVVFSGVTPFTAERGEFCQRHGLTPVIVSEKDWEFFVRHRWYEHLEYEIKFNTGMNRLGLALSSAGAVARALSKIPGQAHPTGILTHLAMAESADAPLTRAQIDKFAWLRSQLSGVAASSHFHLANSAAIWNQKQYDLKDLGDVLRPGLSLYGVVPWKGAPERGLVPVMTLKASVLAVHRLKPGESIGYGGRFRVPTTGPDAKPVHVATLGAGYADGLTRRLSGGLGPVDRTGARSGLGGYAWLGGREQRLLGVVSMDMSAVSATAETKVGDWAELLGPNVDPWAQANAAGTLPYELLTSVSSRVQRDYG